MAKGGFFLEKLRRCLRTVFFMVAMVVSLLVSSLPVLVAIGDVIVPCVLISSFTCVRCYSFDEHLHRYGFKTSLIDIPLVSIVRSLIITCVYSICDGPSLSHGPYLGTVIVCSFLSVLLLSAKVCIFTANSQLEPSSSSFSPQKLHLKKSWGMPVLFLSSVVFALGHIVIAYRTSRRARRKLLLYRVDPEAVLSCKNVFSSYPKVPRSPTPSGGKTPKSDSEIRRKPSGTARDEGELPIRLLADVDSLFISCQGLTLHYKLHGPGSPTRSLSSATFLEAGGSPEIPKERYIFDRNPLTWASKGQYNIQRSSSSQFHCSSLYDPLLDGSATSPVLSEEIPVLRLDEVDENAETSIFNIGPIDRNFDGNERFGIVLVHGFGGGVFSWRHVMGALSRQVGCIVAAFDRPGWGLTPRPSVDDWEEKQLPNPYKLETQVDLLLSFCSEIGLNSVVLVGHDDGGLLALKAAQKVNASTSSCNVSIRGVVLLNVSLSREVVPGFARILLRTSLGKKHLVRPLLRTEITQVVNRRAWYDASKLTTEILTLYKTPLCVEGWDEALREISRLSYETVLSAQQAESLLKAVKDLPVLVVAGAEDALVSFKSSQAMASKLVNARLVAISGCGHLPHEECPKTLLSAVTPFVSRILLKPDSQSQWRELEEVRTCRFDPI